jgi:hypothetical protein
LSGNAPRAIQGTVVSARELPVLAEASIQNFSVLLVYEEGIKRGCAFSGYFRQHPFRSLADTLAVDIVISWYNADCGSRAANSCSEAIEKRARFSIFFGQTAISEISRDKHTVDLLIWKTVAKQTGVFDHLISDISVNKDELARLLAEMNIR